MAMDIMNGQCVRLTKGRYDTQKVYNRNPIEVARSFEAQGIEYLHLVDLDGARSKHIVNYDILESICTKTKLKVDFGGGIKSDEDIKIAFDCGAHQITGGSIAVRNKDVFLRWIKKYGSDRIILGADSRKRKIATEGWLETSELDVLDYISKYEEEGIQYVICTDIEKDGMLQGASNNLYKEIIENTSIDLIASGGVSSLQDLKTLKEIGCEGAIVGKAYYEGRIKLDELSQLC